MPGSLFYSCIQTEQSADMASSQQCSRVVIPLCMIVGSLDFRYVCVVRHNLAISVFVFFYVQNAISITFVTTY